ncbi:MAG TPA: hypothetical protein VK578_24210 [Edaphobacter sp.]|jgi:hypothetical protein|uniref:Stability/partitioning determinant n=1 Tax=Tunturiibacter gelidiferens TaxID=3069689 RepID=A0AAU7YUH7_9BACT|nr:hypothetical protein [Edaphobacter sp.]
MSSKFGLIDDADDVVEHSEGKIDLSGFAPVQKRSPIDLAEVDAAAAPHGFVSREAAPVITEPATHGRRRRAVPSEPTRHLAVRMVQSQYDRFVGYADRYKLTYHDAITKLLDAAGE